MRRVSSEGDFLRWKQAVDDAIRQLRQARNLGTKQAKSFQIGKVVMTAEEQGDGSVVLYARHAEAVSGNRVVVGIVTKG